MDNLDYNITSNSQKNIFGGNQPPCSGYKNKKCPERCSEYTRTFGPKTPFKYCYPRKANRPLKYKKKKTVSRNLQSPIDEPFFSVLKWQKL